MCWYFLCFLFSTSFLSWVSGVSEIIYLKSDIVVIIWNLVWKCIHSLSNHSWFSIFNLSINRYKILKSFQIQFQILYQPFNIKSNGLCSKLLNCLNNFNIKFYRMNKWLVYFSQLLKLPPTLVKLLFLHWSRFFILILRIILRNLLLFIFILNSRDLNILLY